MAVDQTVGLILIGSAWITYKIFSDVSNQFPIVRNLGYWLVLVFTYGAIAYADIIDVGAGSGILEGVTVGFQWFMITFGIFMFILYFKDIVLGFQKVKDFIVFVFTGRRKMR